MTIQWKRQIAQWTIEQLQLHRSRVNLDPKYQRQYVWNRSYAQRLIISILSDFGISMLMFRARSESEGVWYDVVDGKQRLTAILDYIDDKFILPTNAGYIGEESIARKRFSQLSPELRAKMRSYVVPVTEISTTDDNLLVDQFISLQQGKKLTMPERRLAADSIVKDVAFMLRGHALMSFLRMRSDRYQDVHAISQILMYEYLEELTPSNSSTLDKFFIVHANDSLEGKWERVYDYVVAVFDTMQSLLTTIDHSPQWRNALVVTSLYLIFRRYVGIILTSRQKREITAGLELLKETLEPVGIRAIVPGAPARNNEVKSVIARTLAIANYLPIYPNPLIKHLNNFDNGRLYIDN